MNNKSLFKNIFLAITAVCIFAAAAGACMFNPSKKTLRNYLKEHSLVVVKDGKTGFMFRSGEPLSLAEKMKWLIDNHKDVYGAACMEEQRFVDDNFSLDAIVGKYKSYIDNL